MREAMPRRLGARRHMECFMSFDSGNAPVGRGGLSPALKAYLRQHRIQEPDLSNVTEKLLDRLPPPPAGVVRYELRDSGPKAVAGLQIRKASGSGVSFSLRADFKPPGSAKFQSVRLNIGRWGRDEGEKTLSAARDEAAVMRKQLREGIARLMRQWFQKGMANVA
jgi:hypothetical protein